MFYQRSGDATGPDNRQYRVRTGEFTLPQPLANPEREFANLGDKYGPPARIPPFHFLLFLEREENLYIGVRQVRPREARIQVHPLFTPFQDNANSLHLPATSVYSEHWV